MEPSNPREKLDKSFEESFSTGQYSDCFKALYDRMAPSIAELGFDEAFVECSNRRGRLDFNLFYTSGLFISVARPVESNDNVDFFSISRNKKKIIISQLDHVELIERLKEAERVAEDDPPKIKRLKRSYKTERQGDSLAGLGVFIFAIGILIRVIC